MIRWDRDWFALDGKVRRIIENTCEVNADENDDDDDLDEQRW